MENQIVSNKMMLLRSVDMRKYHTLTANATLAVVNTTAEVTIQNKGGTAWVTDIVTIIRNAKGENILEADRRGNIGIDDLRVFINIDSTDFTDKSIPVQALSTRDDNKELQSGFKRPPYAKIIFRFEAKQITAGTSYCHYPLIIDVVLKYYEIQP
jgi:hypothetical protein